MFPTLVDSENDIVGQIAYSLYKKHKSEFLSSLDRDPTDDELIAFKKSCQTEAAVELYRAKAEEILMEFSRNTLSEHAKEIEDSINQDHLTLIKRVVDPIKPKRWQSYAHAVAQSVVSAIVIAIGYAMLVFYFENQGKRLRFQIGTSDQIEQSSQTHQPDTTQAPKNNSGNTHAISLFAR